jgi:hypothetical protein
MAAFKLQPDRTVALRGFDNLGAAAAIHDASPNGFKVTGVFRDASDFAVVILYDADSFYEHLRIKYLPDFSFEGINLVFDLEMDGVAPIDSEKYPTIDWPFLDAILEDSTPVRVRLSDHASVVSGSHTAASYTVSVLAGDVQQYDRLTIWYQNYAFDYIAEGGETAAQVASKLAQMINGTAFPPGFGIRAQVSGSSIRITARAKGADGNHVAMYATWKNDRLKLSDAFWRLSGGSSSVTWRVSIDFAAVGLSRVRVMWLTIAPPLATLEELKASWPDYPSREWQVRFSNWTVSGPAQLEYAGAGSVLVSSESRWVEYSGSWPLEQGFYEAGVARRASEIGDSVTVRYWCGERHELWIGTALYLDRGIVSVQVDDLPPETIDCYLANEPQVITRRRVGSLVLEPGNHKVTITLTGKNPSATGQYFYFDYLQAVVRGSPPPAIPTSPRLAPANDYGTDHGYKLSPQRMMWMMDELGYGGEGNVYVSVFWWNQRRATGRVWPEAAIDFSGQIQTDDQIFLDIGGSLFGKSVFPQDTPATVAYHFESFINEVSVGVWAEAVGPVLKIRPRAIAPAYEFPVSCRRERGSNTAPIPVSGSLTGGVSGTWQIDPDVDPPINVATRTWLEDLCREYAKRSRKLVLAYSMELLYPPDDPASGAVWASRYPNGEAVLTDTGFASHRTTHCTFSDTVRDYHKRVYLETAKIMKAAGLEPWLQFGEFLWWFFSNGSGMAFYDDWTRARAVSRLGRPLHMFLSPDDDPLVNGAADAQLLRDILEEYCREIRNYVLAQVPEAKFELLLALDVNAKRPSGPYSLGGRLNHFVNIPDSFRYWSTAPFDRLKIEALNFGAWSFNLDLAAEAIRWWKSDASWPRDRVRYNVPVFRAGAAWQREFHIAVTEGVPMIMMWAFDHVALFSLPGGDPVLNDQSLVV